jgi:uncharacterized protein (DUF3084 family)
MLADWVAYLASFLSALVVTALAVLYGSSVAGLVLCGFVGAAVAFWVAARSRELRSRERELEGREREVESARGTHEKERRAREAERAELDARNRDVKSNRAALVKERLQWAADRDSLNAEVSTRAAALDARSAELDAREARLSGRAAGLDARDAEFSARTIALDARSADLDKRGSQLSTRADELDDRENLLEAARDLRDEDRRLWEAYRSEWELGQAARTEQLVAREEKVHQVALSLEQRQATIDGRHADGLRQAAELAGRQALFEARCEEFEKSRAECESQRVQSCEQLESRAVELSTCIARLEAREAEYSTRAVALDSRSAELDSREAQLSSRAARFDARDAEYSARAAALDSRSAELDSREAQLSSRAVRFDALDSEFSARSTTLDARSADLDKRDVELSTRVARLVDCEKSLESAREDHEKERRVSGQHVEQTRSALQEQQATVDVTQADTVRPASQPIVETEARNMESLRPVTDSERQQWDTTCAGSNNHTERLDGIGPRLEIQGAVYRKSAPSSDGPDSGVSAPDYSGVPPREDDDASLVPTMHIAREGDSAPLDELPPRNQLDYNPPAPPKPKNGAISGRHGTRRANARPGANLRLRILFDFRRGDVFLVPSRRNGMPPKVGVVGTQAEHYLAESQRNRYEPVPVADVAELLLNGVEWCGRGDARQWRWRLGKRDVYVFAPGDQFGLHGFVSTARLSLHSRHFVVARAERVEQVLDSLAAAGCTQPVAYDESTRGLPHGWLVFRDVVPTRAVPMREGKDVLNVLCPLHKIKPRFRGGIRLTRHSWLAGFPPRIQLMGDLGGDFRLMIDDQTAVRAADGTIEAAGWDVVGKHCLLFGDETVTYELRRMEEEWTPWPAHEFDMGAAICGAGIVGVGGSSPYQVRVPATNPIIIGPREGEIYCCKARDGLRGGALLALVPFAPVWALPYDPVRADKARARVVRLDSADRNSLAGAATSSGNESHKLTAWVMAINAARRKRLALADESKEGQELWRRCCATARRLWRKMH